MIVIVPSNHTTIGAYSVNTRNIMILYLVVLTFGVLVANPKKLLYYTVANPARGLLKREK